MDSHVKGAKGVGSALLQEVFSAVFNPCAAKERREGLAAAIESHEVIVAPDMSVAEVDVGQ